MPDISMCRNNTCPSRNTCYRYTATPSEFYQSYANFKPESKERDKCDYYWKDIRIETIKNNEQE